MKKSILVLTVSLAVLLSACGKKESAAPEASVPANQETVAPAPAPAEPVVAENVLGKKVFNNTCSLCHASGAAGAPIKGNKEEWGPRIAQGKDVLYKHAIEGFTGTKGAMPARGGNPKLTDDEVKAGVDYMVSLAQ
jgi:cytochrome c5